MRNGDQSAGVVITLRHESKVLKENPLGDKFVRDIYVYLPFGYETSDIAYPTVYCLTGFTSRGKTLLNDSAFAPNLAERMDRLIEAGTIRPMIAVMPDCFTYYG